jgi:hypothetical protein
MRKIKISQGKPGVKEAWRRTLAIIMGLRHAEGEGQNKTAPISGLSLPISNIYFEIIWAEPILFEDTIQWPSQNHITECVAA